MARSVELCWLWRCGGCGVIGVGVNGFLFCFFFLGLLVYVISVVVAVAL